MTGSLVADLLYALAARHTLGQLGSPDSALSEAIAHLLALRDNSLQDCERLIAQMLAQRDQWVRAFPLVGELNEGEWDVVRSRLEAPFRRRSHWSQETTRLPQSPWIALAIRRL